MQVFLLSFGAVIYRQWTKELDLEDGHAVSAIHSM